MPHHRVVKIDELVSLFNLPEKQVARHLGICLTSLKKICRQNGIQRWPYRKLKSLDKKINKIETAMSNSGEDPSAMMQKWELLNAEKKNLPFAAISGLTSSAASTHHSSTSSRSRNPRNNNRAAAAAAAHRYRSDDDDDSSSDVEEDSRISPVANAGSSYASLSSPDTTPAHNYHNYHHTTNRLVIKTSAVPSVRLVSSSVHHHSTASSVASSAPTPIHGMAASLGKRAASSKVRSPAAESVVSAAGTVHGHNNKSVYSSSSSDDEDDDVMLHSTAPSTPICEAPRAAGRHRPSELEMDVVGGLSMINAPQLNTDGLIARSNSAGNCEEEAVLLQDYYCRPESARFSARGAITVDDCFPPVSRDNAMDDFFPLFNAEPFSARGDFAPSDADFFMLS